MDAVTALTVVCLARNRFVELLGPMEQIMQREKSDQVSQSAVALSNMVPVISLTAGLQPWTRTSAPFGWHCDKSVAAC